MSKFKMEFKFKIDKKDEASLDSLFSEVENKTKKIKDFYTLKVEGKSDTSFRWASNNLNAVEYTVSMVVCSNSTHKIPLGLFAFSPNDKSIVFQGREVYGYTPVVFDFSDSMDAGDADAVSSFLYSVLSLDKSIVEKDGQSIADLVSRLSRGGISPRVKAGGKSVDVPFDSEESKKAEEPPVTVAPPIVQPTPQPSTPADVEPDKPIPPTPAVEPSTPEDEEPEEDDPGYTKEPEEDDEFNKGDDMLPPSIEIPEPNTINKPGVDKDSITPIEPVPSEPKKEEPPIVAPVVSPVVEPEPLIPKPDEPIPVVQPVQPVPPNVSATATTPNVMGSKPQPIPMDDDIPPIVWAWKVQISGTRVFTDKSGKKFIVSDAQGMSGGRRLNQIASGSPGLIPVMAVTSAPKGDRKGMSLAFSELLLFGSDLELTAFEEYLVEIFKIMFNSFSSQGITTKIEPKVVSVIDPPQGYSQGDDLQSVEQDLYYSFNGSFVSAISDYEQVKERRDESKDILVGKSGNAPSYLSLVALNAACWSYEDYDSDSTYLPPSVSTKFGDGIESAWELVSINFASCLEETDSILTTLTAEDYENVGMKKKDIARLLEKEMRDKVQQANDADVDRFYKNLYGTSSKPSVYESLYTKVPANWMFDKAWSKRMVEVAPPYTMKIVRKVRKKLSVIEIILIKLETRVF